MFGFDIYFDDITSPLLNGAPLDFINNYQNINEVAARRPVYEDFKNQFIKLIKAISTSDNTVVSPTPLFNSASGCSCTRPKNLISL